MQFTFTCDVMCKLNLSLKDTLNNLNDDCKHYAFFSIFFIIINYFVFICCQVEVTFNNSN